MFVVFLVVMSQKTIKVPQICNTVYTLSKGHIIQFANVTTLSIAYFIRKAAFLDNLFPAHLLALITSRFYFNIFNDTVCSCTGELHGSILDCRPLVLGSISGEMLEVRFISSETLQEAVWQVMLGLSAWDLNTELLVRSKGSCVAEW